MTGNAQFAIQEGIQAGVAEGSLLCSKWAARYRIVSADRVANPALAGKWKNETTPYLVEIMDAAHDPNVRQVIFIKSVQVGGSDGVIGNRIGFGIHIDPCKMIYCAETEEKSRSYKIESFDLMVRDTPALASRVPSVKSRNQDNTSTRVKFPGGMLNFVWATSPAQLSSRAAQIIFLDEEDAYEATNEGSAASLIEGRTVTAGDLARIIRVTTPRTKETSSAYVAWLESTQEKYLVPCPQCGEFQLLEWTSVAWEKDEEDTPNGVITTAHHPDTAYYVCQKDGCYIDHSDKKEMLLKGKWVVTNPDYEGSRRGFWINALYSPFMDWARMVTLFLEATKALKEQRDYSQLQTFYNLYLAEWWEEQGETIDTGTLADHCENYGYESKNGFVMVDVPDGVMLLTASVDVQGDRLEIKVIGWGVGLEHWVIAYEVIYSDPARPETWDELAVFLDKEFQARDGFYTIACAAIDSGGHHANMVSSFARAYAHKKWRQVKGSSARNQPIVPAQPSKDKSRVRLWMVGTDTAKDQIFSFLKIDTPGPGYCHFPNRVEFDKKYFQGLCSEKKVKRIRGGRTVFIYEKLSTGKGSDGHRDEYSGRRNEPLDLFVYCAAAREIIKYKGTVIDKAKNRHFTPRAENLPQKTEISENNLENNVKVSQNLPKQPGVTVNKGGGTWANKW